jgi:signal transduction histidine kinase
MIVPIPVESPDQEPTGVALILKDVTQINEQLEMKRSVVSTVSHQLKTPLTSLCMSIHLLLEEKIGHLNEKQVELLVTAREDSSRLVEILDELLDINRMEAGKSNVFIKPIQPEIIVREAIEQVLVEAKDKGIAIVNDVPDDLPEVMADAGKIRHVFVNLFSNAFRFTKPGGTITLRAELKTDFVHFYVEDTGKGIPAEHIKHLFKQFYRVPGQNEKSGVGLGLSIVKEIILAHGGNVSVESELDKGTTLCFSLPIFKKG